MELTLEAYRNIVKNVGSRADMAALCGVSQGFKHAAERALYNTLFMRNFDDITTLLCNTLASSPRLAAQVDALTISLSEGGESSASDDLLDDHDDPVELTHTDWPSVARALKNTTRLRYLNIHVNDGSGTSVAWVLQDCTFQLRKFHCEFDWDQYLVGFLATQLELEDLYISDYRDDEDEKHEDEKPSTTDVTPRLLILGVTAIPKLTTLECTFSEAAMAIVPGRPVSYLKTCFSRTETIAKREEMRTLLSKVKLSTAPLRSLDLADSAYMESFSTELLASISNTRSLMSEVRHLGTFVLPIDGRERLHFYALLMRFPKIQSLEFEVSEWDPPPSSPAALRALASELRLYNPSVIRVVFVQDFDRTAVIAVDGICRVDREISTDLLWREK